tara:strand:- start:5054 stop:5230 length:177 start_codon:yes stop_codon:yes gene_type:complete
MSEHRDKSIFDLMDEMMDLSDSISGKKTERIQKPEIKNQNQLVKTRSNANAYHRKENE